MTDYPVENNIDFSKVKPGQEVYPGGPWREWQLSDLDQNDKVSFVPAYLPALFKPGVEGPHGEKYIYLDVNNLGCWLQVGTINTVNRFFYHAYKNLEDQLFALEYLKRNGPPNSLWSNAGPAQRNTWYYTPKAYTFGMDIDGRFLIGREIKGLETRLYRFFMNNKFMIKHFNLKKRRQLMCRVASFKMRPLLFLQDRKLEIKMTKRNLKSRWQAFKKEWFN